MLTETRTAQAQQETHGAARGHHEQGGGHDEAGGECLNCGAALVGPFCHACGQKETHPHELSLRHFGGHVLHEFTHLDSNKILRTLTSLLFRPGQLTAEYLAGRKGAQINPIRVYLTVSAIYFLFAWGALLNAGGFRDIERHPVLIAHAQKVGQTPRALADAIMRKAEKYSSVLRFSGVLVSGLFLAALYFRTGRFYVEHLLFALHFYSFDFLGKCIYALVITAASAALDVNLQTFFVFRALFYVLLFVYIYFALLRVYGQSKLTTFFKAGVLFALEMGLFFGMVAASFLIAFKTAV